MRENINTIITDHNEIRGAIKLCERAKITTLPAIEAGTKEGLEFLIYFKRVSDIESFYKRAIEPYRRKIFIVQIGVPTRKLLAIAKEYDCFISLAHPFGFRKKSLIFHKSDPELITHVIQQVDALETFNGNLSDLDNVKALSYNTALKEMKETVGSDGHDIKSIGQVTADFDIGRAEFDAEILFEKLSAGEFVKNTHNSISKIKTALIIAYYHSRYFIYDGKSIERISSEDKSERMISFTS